MRDDFRKFPPRMPDYPESTIWYIEARFKSAGAGDYAPEAPGQMGSGVVLMFEQLDAIREPFNDPARAKPKRYLLTCAHVVRQQGTDKLADEILCFPPGKGYTKWDNRRWRETKNANARLAWVSEFSPCQAKPVRARELKESEPDDWVLLELEDHDFLTSASRVGALSECRAGTRLRVLGYPGGASAFLKGGDIVGIRDAEDFQPLPDDHAALLSYAGGAETRPGMSGGGIFDGAGALVGIHRSAADATMKRSAIRATHIQEWLFQQWKLGFVPSTRTLAQEAYGQERLEPALKDLRRCLSPQEDRMAEHWLCYAWYDGGMYSDDRHDSSWWEHVKHRAEMPLDDGVCPLIRLTEGFATLSPDLASSLHAWQDDFNRSRQADLGKSREGGKAQCAAFKAWLKTRTLELQVRVRENDSLRVRLVSVRWVDDGAGQQLREVHVLPERSQGEEETDLVASEYKRAREYSARAHRPPVRYLVPNSHLSSKHGRQLCATARCLAQETHVTLHSAERWGMHSGGSADDEIDEWDEALLLMEEQRDAMTEKHAHLCAVDAAEVISLLKQGRPVILATAATAEEYPSCDWALWPAKLLTCRKHDSTPDEHSFLIYDTRDYTPWDRPMQLFG